MTREQLLAESVADKFIRYARVDTQSDERAKTHPSTEGQLVLAEMLRSELTVLGLAARIDEYGFVYTSLPGNRPAAPAVGFLAHLDTFPHVPGHDVRPILHRNYQGGDIVLPDGSAITERDTPELARMVGHDIITSDGTTLLGVDDKAGVAAIMAAICRLTENGNHPHGPLRIAFTPDEEIGRGIQQFDVAGFGAVCAYTLDAGAAGEFEEENFNAENLNVILTGISAHTGAARGVMINAVFAAADLIAGIPAAQRPETTDGRLGFLHPDGLEGDVERVAIRWLLRDFTAEGLAAKRRLLDNSLRLLRQKYPGLRTRVVKIGAYRNMKEGLAAEPRASAHALAAIRRAGLTPIVNPIRGGTDGARLTYMGLPTPNIFAGGVNFHSRHELVSVQWMERAVDVLLHLAALWADER